MIAGAACLWAFGVLAGLYLDSLMDRRTRYRWAVAAVLVLVILPLSALMAAIALRYLR